VCVDDDLRDDVVAGALTGIFIGSRGKFEWDDENCSVFDVVSREHTRLCLAKLRVELQRCFGPMGGKVGDVSFSDNGDHAPVGDRVFLLDVHDIALSDVSVSVDQVL
jgi:hypothetical protein